MTSGRRSPSSSRPLRPEAAIAGWARRVGKPGATFAGGCADLDDPGALVVLLENEVVEQPAGQAQGQCHERSEVEALGPLHRRRGHEPLGTLAFDAANHGIELLLAVHVQFPLSEECETPSLPTASALPDLKVYEALRFRRGEMPGPGAKARLSR